MLENRITPNSAPVAVADSDSVLHDQWHFVSSPGLLDNDTDADQDPLTAELYSNATNGMATVYSDGSWDYSPDFGFVGQDSFQYLAFDGTDYSDPATVTIQVTNNAPVGSADSDSVLHDQWLGVSAPGVLANDSDADQEDFLTAEIYSNATNGIATVYSDGSWDYSPDMGYVGPDSFQYRAFDGAEYSDPVTVTINVTNSVPVASGDSYNVHQGDTLYVTTPTVLDNDSDADQQDTLSAKFYSGPSNGILTLYVDGTFDYEPDMEFVGQDSFQYQAFDGAEYSDPVTVTIDVTNTEPIGNDDYYWTPIDEGLSVSATNGVLANDSDADDDTLSAILSSGASYGYVDLDPLDGSFEYTPDLGFEGTDTFTYRVFDGAEYSALLTVAIAVQQNPRFVVNVHGDMGDDPDANVGDGMARDGAGNTSLRAAIQEGNAIAGPVTIIFAVGLDGETISLGNELPALDNDFEIFSGNEDVTVSRDPTAADNFRIFTINAGKDVSLTGNLTLTNGRVPTLGGGAIRNQGELLLIGIDIYGNFASAGGGLLNEGTMNINDCRIYQNEASIAGGGAYNAINSNMSVEDSEFFVNDASRGGGIYSEGQLVLLRTEIYGNSATTSGAGIDNRASLTMTNGIINDNELSSVTGKGGGLYNTFQATSNLSQVTISANDAGGNQSRGGGVYAQSGTINLDTCTILNNDAAQGNGGWEETNGDIDLEDCNTNQDFGPS